MSLVIFPHRGTQLESLINGASQSLLFFISFYIFLREPNRKNKFIFLNFVVFFLISFLQYVYSFIGVAFLTEAKYSGHLFAQYSMIAYILLLSVAVIYLVIDLLFRDFKTYQKYLSTFTIVLFFFVYYFYPYFQDPLYLYSTEDIKQWKTLIEHVPQDGEIPAPISLANQVTLQSWQHGVAVGDLYPEENLKRIEELSQYLEGNNYLVLLWKPIRFSLIYMNILIMGFVLLFFGYQYKKDPPQGAYIDKIMFLLLLFSSMEILHNWGYIKSVEWSSMTELFIVGQYITVIIQIMMILFFSLRLQFITSVQGEFYETELATNPQQISRWRDWIDNIVLAQFFNFKIFNGRLFQSSLKK